MLEASRRPPDVSLPRGLRAHRAAPRRHSLEPGRRASPSADEETLRHDQGESNMRNRIVCWWGFALLIALFTAHPASAAGNVGSPFECRPEPLAPPVRKEHDPDAPPELHRVMHGSRALRG